MTGLCGFFLPGYLLALPMSVINGVDRKSIVGSQRKVHVLLSAFLVLLWCACVTYILDIWRSWGHASGMFIRYCNFHLV